MWCSVESEVVPWWSDSEVLEMEVAMPSDHASVSDLITLSFGGSGVTEDTVTAVRYL